MSYLADILDNSRTKKIVQRIERGESIDWNREATLLTLDLVVIGERFAADMIRRDEQADDELAKLYDS